MSEFRKAFYAIDTDNSGVITIDQLKDHMHKMNYRESFVSKWVSLFDVGHQGVITFESYCAVLGLNPAEPRESKEQDSQKIVVKGVESTNPPTPLATEIIESTVAPVNLAPMNEKLVEKPVPEVRTDEIPALTETVAEEKLPKKDPLPKAKKDKRRKRGNSQNISQSEDANIAPAAQREADLIDPIVVQPAESCLPVGVPETLVLSGEATGKTDQGKKAGPRSRNDSHKSQKIEKASAVVSIPEHDFIKPIDVSLVSAPLPTPSAVEVVTPQIQPKTAKENLTKQDPKGNSTKSAPADTKQSKPEKKVKDRQRGDSHKSNTSEKSTPPPVAEPMDFTITEVSSTLPPMVDEPIVPVQITSSAMKPTNKQGDKSRKRGDSNSSSTNEPRVYASKASVSQPIIDSVIKPTESVCVQAMPVIGQPVLKMDTLVPLMSASSNSHPPAKSNSITGDKPKFEEPKGKDIKVQRNVPKKPVSLGSEKVKTAKEVGDKKAVHPKAGVKEKIQQVTAKSVSSGDSEKKNASKPKAVKSSANEKPISSEATQKPTKAPKDKSSSGAAEKRKRQPEEDASTKKAKKCKLRKLIARKAVEHGRFPRSFEIQPARRTRQHRRDGVPLATNRCTTKGDNTEEKKATSVNLREKGGQQQRRSLRRWHLRDSLKSPGAVVILLAGRHKGKRAVYVGRHRTSGLLLVTGPYKYNGVPLRRVHPNYVIATKTRLNLEQFTLPPRVHQKKYFARMKDERRLNKKAADNLFVDAKDQHKLYEASKERKDDQRIIDAQVVKAIKGQSSSRMLVAYLRAMFSLGKRDRPHEMVF